MNRRSNPDAGAFDPGDARRSESSASTTDRPFRGTFSTSTTGNHSHSVNIPAFNSSTTGNHSHSVDILQFNSGSTGGSETRPRNVALLYCIKQ